MNNQAAQTMPALPRPYWKAGEVRDDFGNPYNETDLFTDDDMRAMYRQGYAAALSQTAGVAEGWKLVPVEPDSSVLHAMREAYRSVRRGGIGGQTLDASFQREYAPELAAYHAMLAAAPAASGGEFVNVPRELTTSMLEAAEQEEACGNDFPDMWEAAIATYLFDKGNGDG